MPMILTDSEYAKLIRAREELKKVKAFVPEMTEQDWADVPNGREFIMGVRYGYKLAAQNAIIVKGGDE